MASEFQRNKLQAMFDAFDADGNGYLEEGDFVALADRWARLPRVEPGSELAGRVEDVLLGWWGQLTAATDTEREGRIDIDGILSVVDRLSAMSEQVTATADTIFDAVDENGDGRISRTEHQRLVDTWHGQGVSTGDVFDRLDRDGDGYLGRAEFAVLWTQFWVSDDPREPGNLLCGPLPGTAG